MSTINTIESLKGPGILSDTTYLYNGNMVPVTLEQTIVDFETIIEIDDGNINYANVPGELGTSTVKIALLTYNGYDSVTNNLVETLVFQSTPTSEQPWQYDPRAFQRLVMNSPVPSSTFTNIPSTYIEGSGLTIEKEFLTAEANLSDFYQIKINAPVLNYYPPANVDENMIALDGWYTSYVAVIKKYVESLIISTNQIVEFNGSTWVSLTGVSSEPSEGIDWTEATTMSQWITALSTFKSAEPTEKIFWVQCDHLITIELNDNIIKEVLKTAQIVNTVQFNMSVVEPWITLSQKRLAAYIQFNNNVYTDVSRILDSAREYVTLTNSYEI